MVELRGYLKTNCLVEERWLCDRLAKFLDRRDTKRPHRRQFNHPNYTEQLWNVDSYECERGARQSGYFGGGIAGSINMQASVIVVSSPGAGRKK